jgi:hypothetical protein
LINFEGFYHYIVKIFSNFIVGFIMSAYLVGYDLDKPGQDYSDLEKAIVYLDKN